MELCLSSRSKEVSRPLVSPKVFYCCCSCLLRATTTTKSFSPAPVFASVFPVLPKKSLQYEKFSENFVYLFVDGHRRLCGDHFCSNNSDHASISRILCHGHLFRLIMYHCSFTTSVSIECMLSQWQYWLLRSFCVKFGQNNIGILIVWYLFHHQFDCLQCLSHNHIVCTYDG